jgi:capsular polysaccharide biosynthesis protein
VELRRYLEVSLRWWWLVALAFLATTAVTVSSVASQPATYEASATFVIRPRPVDPSDEAQAFDALIRGVTINTTYASIARSRLIRDRAEEQLDPAARQDDMSVSAKVLTDTNIMSVSVEGPDPDNVVDLATAVSVETIEYVNELSDVYVLEPLDEPTRPSDPVAANKMLTIVVGLVLGVVLGVGLAMLVEYLRKAPEPPAPRKKAAQTPAKTRAKSPAATAAEAPASGDGEAARGTSDDEQPAAAAARRNGEPDLPG